MSKTDLELMDAFTPEDLARWIAYIKIVVEEERKAYEKSKPKGSRRGMAALHKNTY